VEHYEIAAYGSVCAYAELLDRSEDLGLLKGTLEEEQRADEKLTELSETINREALVGSQGENLQATRRMTKENSRSRKTTSAA
ncbi:MAG: DUF892 family protein, partial [Terriglobales bacterium]